MWPHRGCFGALHTSAGQAFSCGVCCCATRRVGRSGDVGEPALRSRQHGEGHVVAELLAEKMHTRALLESQRLSPGQTEHAVAIGEALGEAHRPLRCRVHGEGLGARMHRIRFAGKFFAALLLLCIGGFAGLNDSFCHRWRHQATRGLLQGAHASPRGAVRPHVVQHLCRQFFA